jgi:hypothetical protein
MVGSRHHTAQSEAPDLRIRLWGYSRQVADYVQAGIMDWDNTVEFRNLMKIVEPFEYRQRLTMPKLALPPVFVFGQIEYQRELLKSVALVPDLNLICFGAHHFKCLLSFLFHLFEESAVVIEG